MSSGCPLCGDQSAARVIAPTGHELALLVAEAAGMDYIEHLRTVHPQEYAREHAHEQEMNAALAEIFGRRQ